MIRFYIGKNASKCFVPLIFAKKYQENIFFQIISRNMLTVSRSYGKRKIEAGASSLGTFWQKNFQPFENNIRMFSFCHCLKSDLTPSFERFFINKRSEHVCSVIQIKLSVGVIFLGSFWHDKVLYRKKCIKMLRSINFCQKVPRKYFFPDYF
jgi:hypothetical protein